MSIEYLSERYETLHLICFKLENLNFAMEIQNIQEIVNMQEIRKIPRTPKFILGVINLRGSIIPVISLRKQFDLEPLKDQKNAKIIIFSQAEKAVGFIVDDVSHVIQLNQNDIAPAPPVLMRGIDAQCILGIFLEKEKNILLVDLMKAFSEKEIRILEEIIQQA